MPDEELTEFERADTEPCAPPTALTALLSQEEDWNTYLDGQAAKVNLACVSRQALEELARQCLRWDYGPGFPGGPLSDALDRVSCEGRA